MARADITITKASGGTITVPITKDARRVFNLMKNDYVRLVWNSPDEYVAAVGDRINDPVFGPFYVTEAQSPDFDTNTGSYHYDIRFDREYIGWKNVLHQLTYPSGNTYVRKEAEWSLTDSLQNHLSEILHNLTALGYSYVGNIGSEVESASTAVSVSFSGTSIYDALNTLANAWQCEWWVTYNQHYTQGTIHFGKCLGNGTAYSITLGDNAENIVPSKSDTEYANKIYAYGSTRNIPDTYRKSLVFTVTDTQTQTSDGTSATVFRDSARVITKDMLTVSGLIIPDKLTLSLSTPEYESTVGEGSYRYKASFSDDFLIDRTIRYNLDGTLSYVAYFVRNDDGVDEENDGWAWRVLVDSNAIASGTGTFGAHEIAIGSATKTIPVDLSSTSLLLASGEHTVTVEIWTEYDVMALSSVTANNGKAVFDPSGYWIDCPLKIGSSTYTARFNPLSKVFTRADFNWFSIVGGAPSGFAVGSTYTLSFSDGSSAGLRLTKIPSSYYTDDVGDSNGTKMVGAKRLMLPTSTCPNGYVAYGNPGLRTVVEKVVIFENEYPKLYLQITEIEVGTYSDVTEYADGSKTFGTLPKYTIKAKMVDTSDGSLETFDFKSEYLTTDALSAVFITKAEAQSAAHSQSTSAHLLSGMTFGLQFRESDQTYTMVYNEDYGAKLPNGVLKPNVGDTFILTGWNVKALESLGLITIAENSLEAKARTYLTTVQEPQMTFNCTMMSDSMFYDGLLSEGAPVTVIRDNINEDTRVIGYEYKFDIPEDSPVYICGETDAYSRLKAIEKLLNAQTQSVSASGGTVSASVPSSSQSESSSSGTAEKVAQPLSWVSGSVANFAGDSFDGSEAKTITVPTEVGHLADGSSLPRIDQVVEVLEDGYIASLKDGNGITVYPLANNDWFIVESYTEDSTTKYRLKLNPRYQGVYAEGWISAGGLSTTGGGPLVASLKDLTDVDDDLNPSAGQVLMYDETLGKWTAGNGGGGGSYLPLSGGTMTGSIKMNVESTSTYLKAYTLGHTNNGSYVYDGYLTADSNGDTYLYGRGNVYIRAGYGSGNGRLNMTASTLTYNGTSLLDSWGTTSGSTVQLTVGGTTKTLLLSTGAPGTLDTTNTTAQTTSASEALTGTVKLHKVSKTGSYSDLLNQPDLSVYAPLASPALTGTPTAPTAAKATNSTQIATTEYVKTNLADYVTTSSLTTTLGDYLPLTAGSGKALTGTLYITTSSATNESAIRIAAGSSSAYRGINFYNGSNFCGRFAVTASGFVQILAGNITNGDNCIALRTGNTSSSGFKVTAPSSSKYSVIPGISGTVTINSSTGELSTLNNGMDIGTSSYYVRRIYSRVVNFGPNAWMYYDSVNGCIRTNVPFVSDGYISAGGVSTT